MVLSYNETKLMMEMVMMAIANGNRVVGQAFEPSPEQYKMLCEIANKGEEYIKTMQKDYHLA